MTKSYELLACTNTSTGVYDAALTWDNDAI